MTDMKLSIDALDIVFKNDLKIELKVKFCWNKKALWGISVLFWFSAETCCVMWCCLVSSHKSHAVNADSAF